MMYYDQFNTGKRIQKLRRERYLTQEELAVRLNVSDRHLRSLESGEYIPSIDLFIEIAAFFDVTLDHLIMGKSLPVQYANRQPDPFLRSGTQHDPAAQL